jgi:superoxide reductase
MTKRSQVYRCEVCGNIVDVVHASQGELVCCDQPMTHLEENTVDAAKEKHVPVIEKMAGGFKVIVGSVAHPMEDDHYIEWIELLTGSDILRHFLKPGQEPMAVFKIDATDVTARAYCNKHGFWKS